MRPDALSTLSRPIDLSHRTNRAIVAISLLTFLGGALYHCISTGPWTHSLLFGLISAGASLFGWIAGREVDPDHNASAFVASALSLTATLLLGTPDFLLVLWTVLLLRVLNRSTGLPSTWLDAVIVGAGTALLAVRWGSWAAFAGAGVFFLDALLPDPHRRQIVFGAATGIAGIGLGLTRGWGVLAPLTTPQHAAVVGAGALAIVLSVVLRPRPRLTMRSTGDRTAAPLLSRRVVAAQNVGGLLVLLLFLTHGTSGATAIAPLAAGLVGALAMGIARRLHARLKAGI